MSDTPLALDDLERRVRPLRRVLARDAAARVADDAAFARNLARVAKPFAQLSLPGDLAVLQAEVIAQFDQLDAAEPALRSTRVATAWAALRRLDQVLGLPLREGSLYARRRRRTPAQQPEPPPPPPVDELDALLDEGPLADAEPVSEDADDGRASGDRKPQARKKRAPSGPPKVSGPARRPSVPRALSGPAGWDTAASDATLPDAVTADLGRHATVWSVLTTPPSEVATHEVVVGAGRDLVEGPIAVGGRVRARWTVFSPGGTRTDHVRLQGAAWQDVTWSGPLGPALPRLPLGDKVVLAGRGEGDPLAVVDAGFAHALDAGCAVETTYESPAVDDAVAALLPEVSRLEEPLPTTLRKRHALPSLEDAVESLHQGDTEAAKARLAFDEAMALALGRASGRFVGHGPRGMVHTVVHQHTGDLPLRDLAPELDDAQQAALEDVKRDLRDSGPMLRVLAGDDGDRVDDIVLHAVLTVAESRNQVMVVAPDAPAATMLKDRWETVMRAFGLVPSVVTGTPRDGEVDALRRGEVHVLIGTPAVWDGGLDWRRLGLVVLYEQATYGEGLVKAGGLRNPRPDLLAVVRTPLPSAVWLGAYPTADVSRLPSVVGPSDGTVWAEGDREKAYAALGTWVTEGGQGLVAFPMRRDGTDLLTFEEAEQLVATLRANVLGDAEVAILHGARSSRDRNRALTDFMEGRARVLVATTLVELCPPFPRRTAAVVEHADRLDRQRLLGLRALLGERGHLNAVVGASPEASALAFVEAVCAGTSAVDVVADHPDGFAISEICGASPELHPTWFDPSDVDTLLAARVEALTMLRADGQLVQGSNPALLRLAHRLWGALTKGASSSLPTAKGPSRGSSGRRRRRRRRRR